MFRKIKTLLKELPAYWKLLDATDPVFYAEDAFSYHTLKGYIEELLESHPVHYITSQEDDPLKSSGRFHVYHMPEMGQTYLGRSNSPVLAMTVPDLGLKQLQRPSRKTRCFYIFHSLISSHRGYLETAYDHYDDFFCCHKHHARELTARFKAIGKETPNLHEVGYYKLESIYQDHRSFQQVESGQPSVLIAPSWHTGNLLELAGPKVVDSLLKAGLKVIVRPHPAFFHSIYAKGEEVLAALKPFEREELFEWDTDFSSNATFHSADLMVSDWSGAALEYAFGTERPVLFIDTPYKIRNEKWQKYDIVPFEEEMRPQLGQVLKDDQINDAGGCALALLEQKSFHREKLSELREATIFNFGNCSKVGADLIRDALK